MVVRLFEELVRETKKKRNIDTAVKATKRNVWLKRKNDRSHSVFVLHRSRNVAVMASLGARHR